MIVIEILTVGEVSLAWYFMFRGHGVPISWRSKAQCSVALSSSEAESVAALEAVKEVMFVLLLLQSIKINVKLPIIVRVDNVGASS